MSVARVVLIFFHIFQLLSRPSSFLTTTATTRTTTTMTTTTTSTTIFFLFSLHSAVVSALRALLHPPRLL